MRRIIVVGGGPAGFMAALWAAERAREAAVVEVIESGEALATLLRTGGGRCNLTNAASSPRELCASYPRGDKFLLSVFSRFSALQTMEWFHSQGLPLVVENEGRVFPASDRAADVRDLLRSLAARHGVRVRENTPVFRVGKGISGFVVETPAGAEAADALIIATGGDRRRDSGDARRRNSALGRRKGPGDGRSLEAGRGRPGRVPASGYSLARGMGHEVTPLAPSLSALVTAERWPARLAGLTVSGARAKVTFQGDLIANERGDLLFTHRGISGPLAFRVSSRAAFLPFCPASPLSLSISAAPDENAETVEEDFFRSFTSHPRQSVLTALRARLPRSLANAVLSLAGIDPERLGSQVNREDRKRLSRLVCCIPLSIVSRESGEEMVTAGGVDLDQVDPKTMGSRLAPGLFFCGEVLNIDGFTGGFNLQACWSTGYLAGRGAAAFVTRHS